MPKSGAVGKPLYRERSGKADERRKTQKRASVSHAIYEVAGQKRKASDTKSNVIGSQNGDEG